MNMKKRRLEYLVYVILVVAMGLLVLAYVNLR